MPFTQQEQTQTDDERKPALDTTDNAAKMAAVNDLLGNPEDTAHHESGAPAGDEGPGKSVSELLAEAEKPGDSGESQKPVIPPKTLSELAERTGLKVEDLYAIEIPASEDGGEGQTFGKLKDLAASESDFAGRELEFTERTVKFGNDQAKARQELELVLAALPEGAIKADVLARARRERDVMLDREAVRVLDVIPEWKSDDTKRTDLNGIGEHMAQYGFDKNHVDQIVDHRMLRYMRDNFARMQLVEKALAGVKPVKRIPKGGAAKPVKRAPKIQVTPASSASDQLQAIDNLLNPG
jgi:hypothetical protein